MSILKVRQLAQKHECFTEPSLRWLIFQAGSNGLDNSGAIIRIGRSIFIDEELFFKWFRSNAQTANA